jgi:hypothetical protein
MVFCFFGSFASHFRNKLSIHGSNLNSIFVIMSELKFFLLKGFLIQNFNPMDLINFLKKIKISHLYCNGHIEDDIMQNHEQKQKVKKSEYCILVAGSAFICRINLFFFRKTWFGICYFLQIFSNILLFLV